MSHPLNPEIWLVVFRTMVSVPVAHQTPIEKLRAPANLQSTLAACAGVSKQFHELAAPLLYKYPIVYSLPLFVVGIHNQPVFGLSSKADLLAHTQRLFLEISPDSSDRYQVPAAAANNGREHIAVVTKTMKEKEPQQLLEAQEILRAWRVISDKQLAGSCVFSRLKTVSVGAILGDQGVWPKISRSLQWRTIYADTRHALRRFLTDSTGVRYFCQAGPGIFALDGIAPAAPCSDQLVVTSHSTAWAPKKQMGTVGFRTKWIIHALDRWDINHTDIVLDRAQYSICDAIAARQHLAACGGDADVIERWCINGVLYVGQAVGDEGPAKEQRKEDLRRWAADETDELRQALLEGMQGLPEGINLSDDFEVRPLWEASCAACGWSGADED